jgi:hypothetical protein
VSRVHVVRTTWSVVWQCDLGVSERDFVITGNCLLQFTWLSWNESLCSDGQQFHPLFFSKTNEITAHLNSFTIYISNSIYKHKLSTITQIDNYCKFNIQTQIGDYCCFELYFIRDSLWYWFTQCWANIHSGYISWLSFLSVLAISSCDVCQNNDGICKIAAPMIMFLLIVQHLGY